MSHPRVRFSLWFPKEAQALAAFAEIPDSEWEFQGMGGDDETWHRYLSDWRCMKKAEADQLFLEDFARRFGGEVEGQPPQDNCDYIPECECDAPFPQAVVDTTLAALHATLREIGDQTLSLCLDNHDHDYGNELEYTEYLLIKAVHQIAVLSEASQAVWNAIDAA